MRSDVRTSLKSRPWLGAHLKHACTAPFTCTMHAADKCGWRCCRKRTSGRTVVSVTSGSAGNGTCIASSSLNLPCSVSSARRMSSRARWLFGARDICKRSQAFMSHSRSA